MYESIFTFACTYAHSANLIETHGEETDKVAFLFPATVCQAFAIELFLKFFIVVDHPAICCKDDLKDHDISFQKLGHSCSKMWDAVPAHHQAEVVKHYKERSGASISEKQFRERLLEIDDNPFVKWRYVHEENGFSFLRQDQLKLVTNALGYAAQSRMNQIRQAS